MKNRARLMLIPIPFLLISLFAFGLWMFTADPLAAANPSGDLRIEIFTAYNVIVDSNVETPATYAPEAFHVGMQVCNDGSNAMTDVSAYIGNYIDGSSDTPGVYPFRTHSGLIGTFSLTHHGGSAGTRDAVRYVGNLAAGACATQYWLVGYPRLDDTGKSVTLGIKPDDDLWLEYDVWATALDAGVPTTAEMTRKVTMRNEISAMANKIWPNTSSKVPNEFLEVINSLGWSNPDVVGGAPGVFPGQTTTIEGIWYDLGNVRFGFDNNGDFLPDFNVWMQPVGDPAGYDAGCFRLVKTDTLLVVKLTDGSFDTRTVTNQLYFENLPQDNRGAVGLVYYTFAALNGTCGTSLTPYQEVASGYDNEKFSGDYGRSIPPLKSQPSEAEFDKAVNLTVLPGPLPATLSYTLTFTNTGTVPMGAPDLGVPLVVQDSVPPGTTYVGGSAAANNTVPVAYRILYSTNGGSTWSTTEPAAASVTDVQWWLEAPFAAGQNGFVTFQLSVPGSYSETLVINGGGLSFGNASPFLADTAATLLPGPNSLGSAVWADNGGTSGLAGNGGQEGGEAGIPNIKVSLYYDANGNGALDAGDLFLKSTDTNGSGGYLFSNLADGRYLAVVDSTDSDLISGYQGWGNTTPLVYAVDLDAVHATTSAVNKLKNNFGFAPVLGVTKKLSGTSPIYEGHPVTYTITLKSNLPGNGSGTPTSCAYTVWANQEDAGHSGTSTKVWSNISNAFSSGEPNKLYASADFVQGSNKLLAGTGFTLGDDGSAITKVELLFPVYVSQALVDDYALAFLYFNDVQVGSSQTISTTQLNQRVGSANATNVVFNVTGLRTWSWADFSANKIDVALEGQKNASPDTGLFYLDSFGLRVTSSRVCDQPELTLAPLPLTDTYDPTKLRFVSAVPAVSSSAPTGTLSWADLGPLYAGGTRTITVTFKALEPTGNLTQTITNTATITNAKYVNGLPANTATSSAAVSLAPTGSITGVVWSDLNSNGWLASTFGPGAGEPGIPGTTVTLRSCSVPFTTLSSCGGTTQVWTKKTDVNGRYAFDGLLPGRYYTVVTTSPGGTQTGDPEDDNNSSTGTTGNYGTCGAGAGNALCDNGWLDAGNSTNGFLLGVESWGGKSWDVTNINFGYSGAPATVYGNIWYDVNGNSVQTTAENPLQGVTVYLCATSPCTSGNALQTTTTDSKGDYNFKLSSAGNYFIGVNKTLSPLGTQWNQTVDPDESGVCTTCDSIHGVTVALGQTYGAFNFAYTKSGTAQIGDMVFYDWNGNGIQDAVDEGAAGRTVFLYEDFNNDGVINVSVDPLISMTVTANNGYYNFAQLPGGNYLVRTSAPTNTLQTKDPDKNGTCSLCDNQGRVIGLPVGGITTTVDFGYKPFGTGSIGDTVFIDKNGDGVHSGVSETGIGPVTVDLWVDLNGDGSYVLLTTTQTNSAGTYLFTALPDGAYRVIVSGTDPDLPRDAYGNNSVPTTPGTKDVGISGGSSYLEADFGFAPLGAVGDRLFWDANNNGSQDWNESGIAGVTVTLTNTIVITTPNGVVWPVGTYVTTTVTANGSGSDPAGFYLFDELPPGDYRISVDTTGPIGGAAQTADPDRDGETCDSTIYPSLPTCDNGKTMSVTYGTNDMSADFGYKPAGVFGDFVWLDQNGDGVQDPAELGLSGVVITITKGLETYTTTTDADGGYSFQGLGTGTWTVSFGPPAGMTPTTGSESVGALSTTVTLDGSGMVTAVGGTGCTDCALMVDLGLEYNGPYQLTGSVCLESAGFTNGGCGDGSDTLLSGQTVFLYNDAGLLLGSTTTGGGGVYTFTNLITDNYYLVLGTETSQLANTNMTTTSGNSPANSANPGSPVSIVTETAASVYQLVTVNGTTAGGDNAVTVVDFANVSTLFYDFGDLPKSYSTTLDGSPSGPRHVVPTTPVLYLGTAPDTETNGSPGALANGDGADEDGVIPFGTWSDGPNGGQLNVAVTGSGWLVGWIDFNGDGDFYDSGEMVVSQAVTAGTIPISVNVPTGTFTGSSTSLYSRFRLFGSAPSFPSVAFTGTANGGEVEDYIINFSPTAVSMSGATSASSQNNGEWISWLVPGFFLLSLVFFRVRRRGEESG